MYYPAYPQKTVNESRRELAGAVMRYVDTAVPPPEGQTAEETAWLRGQCGLLAIAALDGNTWAAVGATPGNGWDRLAGLWDQYRMAASAAVAKMASQARSSREELRGIASALALGCVAA